MNPAQHLELHLGRMERGWSSKSLPGIQICLFRDQPIPNVSTLTTLGLSNSALVMNEGRRVRQELVFATDAEQPPDDYAKLLLHVAEGLHASGRALLRGDIVSLESPITACSAADASYAPD